MEKVMVTLRTGAPDDAWAEQLRGPVAQELLALGLPGVTVNVRDADVRDSMMTLTVLDPPVQAVVSLWTQQYYGDQVLMALELLGHQAEYIAAYLVTESAPLPPPTSPIGERSPGLANMALLRRPAHIDEPTWLSRWHGNHTPVAIATQSTFTYVQNYVVRALTEDAPVINAIVEEHFPIESVRSLHAFFGAADDADLQDRMEKMVASTAAFGANVNIDAVPTSRYVLRSPFVAEQA
ncbi:EthD domain-containing protein [Mycolicibacterium sphagni]|uniref:EthD domain-containing protein n=1 Tax=Mycolicibacterium sphagni TaxID=1786 RepID=UPI0021F2845F|nr:EthD domain-containing protein [Mycolicibacterium sphagni]MCV7175532.1 EthD domain-containing protein [Mycolicibacterium sphagni]